MDWSLQRIELKNFKFFKKPFIFPVNGKHILLYGENGSGKSSIVWGLYTLMESHRKQVPDIQKYFDPIHDQHLRNRYSQVGDDAYVKAYFESSVPGNSPKAYEISAENITTQTPGDTFIKYTAAAFDMFNYRMLAEWIYQKNSRKLTYFRVLRKTSSVTCISPKRSPALMALDPLQRKERQPKNGGITSRALGFR